MKSSTQKFRISLLLVDTHCKFHVCTSLVRMGIIYQFAIRFITVNDIAKVDKRCVCDGARGSEKEKEFNEYLIKAKENRIAKLKEVSLDPCWKSGYEILDISIPEGTQVITFGNAACDSYGGGTYQIDFYYSNKAHDYSEYICADYERNRFMLIPKIIDNSLPVKMDYQIGYTLEWLEYTEECCKVTYF